MVRYVVYRRNRRDIPPMITFRNFTGWTHPWRGHIKTIGTPQPAHEMTKQTSEERSDDEHRPNTGPWADDARDDDSHTSELAPHQPTDTSSSIGHARRSTSHPSDTCPHTCLVMNQNVNGLGNGNAKIEHVQLMKLHNISAFCAQETWILHNHVWTI